MGITLTKDSIDLGIVVRDIEAALRFYRDTLGFIAAGDSPMPGGAHMHRLMCGTSMIKLITIDPVPEARGTEGRHRRCQRLPLLDHLGRRRDRGRGHLPRRRATRWSSPSRELLPGVSICIVEDPDGNLVEFLQTG